MDGEITGRIVGELLELQMHVWAEEPCLTNEIPYLDQKKATAGRLSGENEGQKRNVSVSKAMPAYTYSQ